MRMYAQTRLVAQAGIICLCICFGWGVSGALADDSDWISAGSEPTIYASIGKADLAAGDQIFRYTIEGLKFDAEAFAESHFGEENLRRMTVRQEGDGKILMKSTEEFGALYYAYSPEGGWITAIKPGNIPLSFNNGQPGDSAGDPLPSPDEGLRSADESDAYIRTWFAEQFGLDPALLSSTLLDQENPEKDKSKMYLFSYDYLLDGRLLRGTIENDSFVNTFSRVFITDEGIVHAIGPLWRVAEKEEVDTDNILTFDELSHLPQFEIDDEYLFMELCYALFPMGDGKYEARPIWYIFAMSDHYYFDAFTGERY